MKFRFRNALLGLAAFAMAGGVGAGIALAASESIEAKATTPTTVTANILEIANHEKLASSGTRLSTLPIASLYGDSILSITGTTNGDNSKVYGTLSGATWTAANWRFYSSSNPKGQLTISVADGYSLVSLTAAYTGTLQYGTSNLESGTPFNLTGLSSVVFTCTANARITNLIVEYTVASTDPDLSVNSSMDATTGLVSRLSVTHANLTANINVTQSSTNGGAVKLSLDGETYTDSLNIAKSEASPVTVYVQGQAKGNVTLSFATTGVSTKTCAVTVSDPTIYERIDNVSKIKNGGSFVIANSADVSLAMCNTQSANNRGSANVALNDGKIYLGKDTQAAIVTISKGTGDHAGDYTIYEALSDKYLYAVNGENYLRGAALGSTNYYYWSIAFSGSDVVFTNKGENRTIRFNASSSVFSCYTSGQTAVALFELVSDIPANVALASISGENSTVEAGSHIVYAGTYLPANATEAIIAASSDEKLTFGDILMDGNGNFTVTVTADIALAAGNYTITFNGASPTTAVTPKVITFAVTAYVPTHNLVTDAAVLQNGAKVVFGCIEEGYDFSAVASTGGNNLDGVACGFAGDKSTLAEAETTQEYTVWCVDSENGYYVFSDGGYFLASATSKNNYLRRTDKLAEECYFTITNDASGVVIQNAYGVNHGWKDVESPYTVGFNLSTSKFSLYLNVGTSAVGKVSLYLSQDPINTLDGFVATFLHFGNVAKTAEGDTNACRDSGSGAKSYYALAKAAFNALSALDRDEFYAESGAGKKYEDAYARLAAWALANGDAFDFDGESHLILKSNPVHNVFGTAESRVTLYAVIGVLSVGVLAGAGMFFISKKRKRA